MSFSTHILDTSRGRPAEGLPVELEILKDGNYVRLGAGSTDADGRIKGLVEPGAFVAGQYRISFDTGSYFEQRGVVGFYPEVKIVFEVSAPAQHYHVPLLLSPYGYSTYRGS